MSEITVRRVDTGMPVRTFVGSPDFIGDKPFAYTETYEYHVLCSRCGLVEKADTRDEGERRGASHLRRGHR